LKTLFLIISIGVSFYLQANNIVVLREKVSQVSSSSSNFEELLEASAFLIHHYTALEPNSDSAYFYLKEGLRIAEQLAQEVSSNTHYWAGIVYAQDGLYHHSRNEPNLAIHAFIKASDHYRKSKKYADLAESLNNLAVQYKNIGESTLALTTLEEALLIFQQQRDSMGIANSLNTLSIITRDMGDLDQALIFSEESLRIHRLTKNRLGEAQTLNSMAGLYKEIGDTTAALVFYEKALSLRKELNDYAGEAVILNNIGVLYKNQGKDYLALDYFNKSLVISQLTDNVIGQGHALLNIGEVNFNRANYAEALRHANEAHSIGETTNNAQVMKKALSLLVNTHKILGNWQLAFSYQEQLMELNQLILNEQSLIASKQASLRYEFEREQMLLNHEREREEAILEERSTRNRMVNVAMTGIAILLLIMVVIIAQRLKTVRLKNKVIEKQNDERKLLLQEVHHRVKNNFQIVASLLRLQSYTIDDELITKTMEEAVTRINAMAAVHDIIYRQEEFSNIQTSEYLNKLMETLQRTVADKNIEFEIMTDDTIKDIETLIHLGIVINELVINSIKYAFPKDYITPKIYLSLKSSGDMQELIYKDNGVGIDPNNRSNSFGMELIETIVEQIEGDMIVKETQGWKTTITIRFVSVK
jgi:two-component system, sensor histidine kinase PdtaS